MLIGWVEAILASDLDADDKRTAVLIAALGWLGVRLTGGDDYAKTPKTRADLYQMGMPRAA